MAKTFWRFLDIGPKVTLILRYCYESFSEIRMPHTLPVKVEACGGLSKWSLGPNLTHNGPNSLQTYYVVIFPLPECIIRRDIAESPDRLP